MIMRRFFLISAGILFLFSSSAFIFTKQQTSNFPNPSTHKIMEIASLWELLSSNYEPNWDRDQTWLDVGIRSKYAKAKNYASLKMIEEAVRKSNERIGRGVSPIDALTV